MRKDEINLSSERSSEEDQLSHQVIARPKDIFEHVRDYAKVNICCGIMYDPVREGGHFFLFCFFLGGG